MCPRSPGGPLSLAELNPLARVTQHIRQKEPDGGAVRRTVRAAKAPGFPV